MGSRSATGVRAVVMLAMAAAAMGFGAGPASAATRPGATQPSTTSTSATPSGATQATATGASTTPSAAVVGNDISFPQCGVSYPSGQAFGVVGVNDGLPDTLNPCFGPSPSFPNYTQSELYWAVSTSTGGGGHPKASLYVNTSDPGNNLTGTLVPDWPTSGSTPYGPCTVTTITTGSGSTTVGANTQACAWEFGDQKAVQDVTMFRTAAEAIDAQSPPVNVPTTPSAYPWWLDVETANVWLTGPTGQAMNLAALQGIVVGLESAGAPSVGVYSTPRMWAAITGGTNSSTATIGKLDTWLPGASTVAGTQTTCAGGSFTSGPVVMAQFPDGAYDGDVPCGGFTATKPTATRVYGQTAEATAAAEFTRAFPPTAGLCPGTRAAVIATSASFQDALSSQFLAQYLTTGTLLTPTASLSQVTVTTLRAEGIATVYVVGGPFAISTTVVQAIDALTAFECGGIGTTGKMVAHRIYGETAYGTAKDVADFVGTAASKAFPGAFSTTNATGGTGRYNDTAGTGTAAPRGAEPTAILASGMEFQDAQAASVISYHTQIPLLLTTGATLSTTAVAAMQTLGIKQVIVMGGQFAISNTVEAALVAKTGAAVLRVAGTDYTDTALQLARFEVAVSTDGLSWTFGHRVMVARGDFFTDGLAGAVLESHHNTATGLAYDTSPLLLTESPTAIGTYLTTFLKVTGHTGIDRTSATTIDALTVLGGPLAVTTAQVAAMESDLGS